MIVVTGGAGFIGANIIKKLNQRGIDNIVVVDDLTDGAKFANLVDLKIQDYIDHADFLSYLARSDNIQTIFHEGACSDTTQWDGRFMMQNNYEYSKQILAICLKRGINLLYASSAAVYGGSSVFKEAPDYEKPLNVYGYSKLLFDNWVRRLLSDKQCPIQIAGFRYFNVYGPKEQHKGKMASVAFHLNNQLAQGEAINLFEGSDGYQNGEQRRDFVYVDDVADVNLWFLDNPSVSGIFNVGTGKSQSFKDVANSVIDWHKKGKISYIPFPAHLQGHYQSFTEADISQLRAVGYDKAFCSVEEGVKLYLDAIACSSII